MRNFSCFCLIFEPDKVYIPGSLPDFAKKGTEKGLCFFLIENVEPSCFRAKGFKIVLFCVFPRFFRG